VPVFFLLFAVIEPPLVLWATIVFVLAGLSDWYDGYYARRLNVVTPLGAFLDPLADKLLTSAAFIAFATRGLIPVWMVALVLFRDIYLTLFRVAADSLGVSVRTSFFAKMKTFTQMVFIGLVLLSLTLASLNVGGVAALARDIASPEVLYWVMLGVTVMTTLSGIEYTYDNYGVLASYVGRLFGRRSPQEL